MTRCSCDTLGRLVCRGQIVREQPPCLPGREIRCHSQFSMLERCSYARCLSLPNAGKPSNAVWDCMCTMQRHDVPQPPHESEILSCCMAMCRSWSSSSVVRRSVSNHVVLYVIFKPRSPPRGDPLTSLSCYNMFCLNDMFSAPRGVSS